MTQQEAERDFKEWWYKAVLALSALKMIIKNPFWKVVIQSVINIGNSYFYEYKSKD